jgi:hypothetical protein
MNMQPDFPASMAGAVGEELRVVPTDPELSAEERYELGHGFGMGAIGTDHVAHYGHDVVAPAGRLGSLDFAGRTELARMACADGVWCLQKRRARGWELLIESADARHVGWYSGRRWLPGGTIFLTDGTQVGMRRSLNRRWKLQTMDARLSFVEIWRNRRARQMSLTIRSLPADIDQVSVVILTACAVLMLEWTAPHPSVASAGA